MAQHALSSARRRLGRWSMGGFCVAAFMAASHGTVRSQSEPIPTEVASSVDRGLAWLAKQQESNGSFEAGGGSPRAAAVTGLAAMAFMARGHVPGQGPYGENLNRAVDYVLGVQRDGGLLAERGLDVPMYDHGICTIMLCEAYGMLDDRRQEAARTAISRAVNLIINAQRIKKTDGNEGGWRYTPTTNQSDISVSGWQLMALRAAANAGANIPPDVIRNGINYIKRCQAGDGSFRYTTEMDFGTPHARTATGVLSLILLGEEQDDVAIKNGAKYLLTTPGILKAGHHFYTLYYCAQAAWQLGGVHWTQINADVSADLRKRQARDGSWPSPGDNDSQGGTNYATAMAILSLTVPYRYLPLYQR